MRTGLAGSLVLLLAAALSAQQPLEGTRPLERQGDLALGMVDRIDRYLMRRLAESPSRRTAPKPNDRELFKQLIGVVDPRVPFQEPALQAALGQEATIAETAAYELLSVRWPVLDGLDADGLLLRPKAVSPRAYIVNLVDPEIALEQAALDFAELESGSLVLFPLLIDRTDTLSGSAIANRWTNQPHREYIYRMAYEMGRHIVGYEVQKVLAAVDWFSKLEPKRPIMVIGQGEGGLVALYSAAVDERIQRAAVSGYFQPRESVWQEPIYRNVWSQLTRFGDAEIAGLISPRTLVLSGEAYPEVAGPPPEKQGRRGAAPGRLQAPSPAALQTEVERARRYHPGVQFVPRSGVLTVLFDGKRMPAPARATLRYSPDPAPRLLRSFEQMIEFTQRLVRHSEFRRREFFSKLDRSSVEALQRSSEPYRKHLWEEVIGRMPPPDQPLQAQTRLLYDRPAYRGYEVLLPVWEEDVYAYGVLLVPKNLKPGERRPVVVAQHGLEGRPQFLVDPPDARQEQIYKHYAAALAERGFIVYAPQNPYLGGERFRVLLRKAHPLKLTLFSFILGQHERTLEWISSLPFVDPGRIGFYGLSYGGKTAMRVPSLLPRYALSICSADFNEWIAKITTVDHPFSYMFTLEYDMLEFNLGNTFNYAEMAYLIAPRPFMVERGHDDGVGIDEWVASEYAKVRRFYNKLGIGDRTAIEFFNGPHEIHGVGTFRFLTEHLNWR